MSHENAMQEEQHFIWNESFSAHKEFIRVESECWIQPVECRTKLYSPMDIYIIH